jgi:hypothetical protein
MAAPKLERQKSVFVDLGSDQKIGIQLETKKVVLLKKGQVYPQPLATETTETHDGIETTAHRTAIGMEPLEFLLDEFPDSIKETIVGVIGSD